MPSAPPTYAKILYQIALAANLVFLFVALVIVRPTSRFGHALTLLAFAASLGTALALKKETDRECRPDAREETEP